MKGEFNLEVLKEALKKIDEIEMNMLDHDVSIQHAFTDNFKKNMNRILKKAKSSEWFFNTAGARKVAMAAIIVLAGVMAVTVTVPAFRKKIIYMLEKTFPKYFDVQMDKECSRELLKKKNFTIKRVPLGLKLKMRVRGEQEIYQNETGGFISFKYGVMPEAAVWADIGSLEIKPDKLSGLWQKEKIIGGMKQLTWKDSEYIFSLATNMKDLDLYTLAEQTDRRWTKYVPTYLPGGFQRTNFDDEAEHSLIYEKGELYIAIDYDDVDAGAVSFDNEHTIIEKKNFLGCPAYFTWQRDKKDKTNSLTWYDDEYFFGVTTNISREETYKVARGLKKK